MASGCVRVALTGGIATGKSYCLDRRALVQDIDADVLARDAGCRGNRGPGGDRSSLRFVSASGRRRARSRGARSHRLQTMPRHAATSRRSSILGCTARSTIGSAKLGETPGPAPSRLPTSHCSTRRIVTSTSIAWSSSRPARRRTQRGTAGCSRQRRLTRRGGAPRRAPTADRRKGDNGRDYVIDTSGTLRQRSEQIRSRCGRSCEDTRRSRRGECVLQQHRDRERPDAAGNRRERAGDIGDRGMHVADDERCPSCRNPASRGLARRTTLASTAGGR